MSRLPLNDPYDIIEGTESLSIPLDSLDGTSIWSQYQDIISRRINDNRTGNNPVVYSETPRADAGVQLKNELKSATKNTISTPSYSTKTTRKRSNCRKNISNEQSGGDQEEGTSEYAKKKMEHNAKERTRRMKLNASYLALGELVPNSRRSKKKWTAPAIVDRALKYIPELENQVEALKSKKENANLTAKNNKTVVHENIPTSQYQSPAVLINKINQEEAIVQMSVARSKEDHQDTNGSSSFTNLLHRLEDEGICVNNASTVHIYDSGLICYTLHIQIKRTPSGTDYSEELRKKIVSWLSR